MLDINEWAVLVSAIAAMILGFLWYGPLFGKTWMKLMGYTDEHIAEAKSKGMMWKHMLGGLIGALITACVLAYLIAGMTIAVGGNEITRGLCTAFLVWLGFFATAKLSMVLWESKSWKLYFLNISYDLVNLLVAGLIIGWWA